MTHTMTYTDFVDVFPELGQMPAYKYDSECRRLDDCYTAACEGTPYTILARPGRDGEAAGIYAVTSNGLQILGHSIDVPDAIDEIMRLAWETYCEPGRTIRIDLDDRDAPHIDAVRSAVTDLPLHDPDCAQAKIVVERGDFTCINGADELTGMRLLAIVRGVCDPNE
jgi:hypothetical protein